MIPAQRDTAEQPRDDASRPRPAPAVRLPLASVDDDRRTDRDSDPTGEPFGSRRVDREESRTDDPDPSTRWALAAREGDPAAQAAFVRSTQAEVWRFAAALVDPGSADDLTQETYLRAFRALPSFQGRSTVRTWLLGIARRACADHLRTVVRRRRLSERLAAHVDADQQHPDPAGQLGVDDLLRRLGADRREAFVLTQLIGLSYAEAAAVAGVPVGTIRSRVARARSELVEAVGDALAG